jgi:CheY-like chemotaxis protein
VDENEQIIILVRELLKQLGVNRIDEAFPDATAFEKIHEKNYDLVISDWNTAFKKRPEYANLPSVLMTVGMAISEIAQTTDATVRVN